MLILFMLPVILSSVLGGFGPGLTATAIASLGIDYYGIPPLHSLQIGESHDLFQWFMLINFIYRSTLNR
jgi:K+-sensing histidine kinase KdpD